MVRSIPQITPRPGESYHSQAARIVDADEGAAAGVNRLHGGWRLFVKVWPGEGTWQIVSLATVWAWHPERKESRFFRVCLPGHLSTPCSVSHCNPPPGPEDFPTAEEEQRDRMLRRAHSGVYAPQYVGRKYAEQAPDVLTGGRRDNYPETPSDE